MNELTVDMCIRVNSPQVIHETIDSEVIVINLSTGSYYSLKGSAAEAWSIIEGPTGVRAADLFEALSARFELPAAELQHAFAPFLSELEEEGLVSRTGASAPLTVVPDGGATNGRPGRSTGLEPPLLEKYTDMQDLVLLDPVHEVDPTGWPAAQPNGGPGGSR